MLSVCNGTHAFVNALLTICLQTDELSISPSLISSISQQSLNAHVGAMLLEKQISVPQQPVRKRHRTVATASSASSNVQDCWIALAEVYTSLHDDDIIRGLLRERIRTISKTSPLATALNQHNLQHAFAMSKQSLQHSADDNERKLAKAMFIDIGKTLLKWDDMLCILQQGNIEQTLLSGNMDASVLASCLIRTVCLI